MTSARFRKIFQKFLDSQKSEKIKLPVGFRSDKPLVLNLKALQRKDFDIPKRRK